MSTKSCLCYCISLAVIPTHPRIIHTIVSSIAPQATCSKPALYSQDAFPTTRKKPTTWKDIHMFTIMLCTLPWHLRKEQLATGPLYPRVKMPQDSRKQKMLCQGGDLAMNRAKSGFVRKGCSVDLCDLTFDDTVINLRISQVTAKCGYFQDGNEFKAFGPLASSVRKQYPWSLESSRTLMILILEVCRETPACCVHNYHSRGSWAWQGLTNKLPPQ